MAETCSGPLYTVQPNKNHTDQFKQNLHYYLAIKDLWLLMKPSDCCKLFFEHRWHRKSHFATQSKGFWDGSADPFNLCMINICFLYISYIFLYISQLSPVTQKLPTGKPNNSYETCETRLIFLQRSTTLIGRHMLRSELMTFWVIAVCPHTSLISLEFKLTITQWWGKHICVPFLWQTISTSCICWIAGYSICSVLLVLYWWSIFKWLHGYMGHLYRIKDKDNKSRQNFTISDINKVAIMGCAVTKNK